jgi:hypothetical protein
LGAVEADLVAVVVAAAAVAVVAESVPEADLVG